MNVKAYKLLDDSVLIKKYQDEQDNTALEILITRHKNKLYTAIFFIVKNREIAEDIFQETFIKTIKFLKRKKYDEKGKFAPWMGRIAHNLAIDHIRRQKKYSDVPLESNIKALETQDCIHDPFEAKIKQDTINKLRNFVQQLPDNQRDVLIMRHYMKMSFQEIAASTNVSINTAIGRMRYALINLKKEFDKIDKNYARVISY